MKRKRINSVIAMVLVVSMIFGSNVSAFGDEISQNTASAEENVTEETVIPEDTAAEPASQPEDTAAESGNDAAEAEAENNDTKEAESVLPDEDTKTGEESSALSEDMAAGENEAEEKEETNEAVGAAQTKAEIFLSGNTVSYDGSKQKITISSNVSSSDGYKFTAWVISASGNKTLDQYTYDDFKKGTSENNLTVNAARAEYTVSAVNAGKYAVSVNVSKDGKVSANAVAFLSIKKAAAITLSVNGSRKYYDGSPLLPSGKVYEVNGKELYDNAITNKNDIELVTVSGSQTDAGKSDITLDASKLNDNYSSVQTTAGKLEVVSSDLVISSKDVRKNYDRKKLTDAERKGITVSSPNADISVLSEKLGLTVDDFDWDQSSLISGDEILVSENKFKLNESGKKKIYGVSDNKAGNFSSVRLINGKITVVNHGWTSNKLTAPAITSVNINKKGWVTIKWKAAKTYKDKNADDKKKNQPRYMIYRYDDVNKDWILLNGNNKTNAAKKETDEEFGQTERSFVDKQAGREESSTYIYKVNVIGYDENLNYGMASQASYKACQPMPLALATVQHDEKSLDYQISKIRGAQTYHIEKSLTGKKNEFETLIDISADKIEEKEYIGPKLVQASSYNDKGNLVTAGVKIPAESVYYTDSKLDKGSFYYYRAKVAASVVDFSQDGAILAKKIKVESDLSAVMKAKCTPYPPEIISVGSVSYNHSSVAFEKLSEDIIPIGSAGANYKYQILRSTKADSDYKVVKTLTGKQLAGSVDNLQEVPAKTQVKINGLNYTYGKDSYIYTFRNLKPEITYYYKVRVVCNGVTGAASKPLSVTPMMDDVSFISANSKNYDQIVVSTNYVTGAKQMVITYRAVMDASGKELEEGKNKDSTWKRKTFTINKDKDKNPITRFTVGGLKHGYTYIFYAEPKNGRKHVTKNPLTAQAYTIVGTPVVKTSPKDLDEIYVQWAAVRGASRYKLEIFDVESGDTEPVKTVEFKKAGKHTWKGGSAGELDGKNKKINTDLAGKPYAFRVTAIRKDSYYTDGREGVPSEKKTEAGRPTGVKELKVAINKVTESTGDVYYPDGFLSWKHSSDHNQTTPLTYMIKRKVYKYKTNTTNSFETGFTESSILDYQAASKKLKKVNNKWVSYTSYRSKQKNIFSNGDKVIYEITPVYNSGIIGRGANGDGYILGVTRRVTYITPAEIIITPRTEVTVGSSATVGISFRPTSTTVKALEWTASSEGSKYFSWNGATVTGKTAMSDWNSNVYVKAASRVNGATSAKGLIKVNAKPVDASTLKVCIDAGHGGSDSGATYNGMLEKSCNLDMAYAMKAELEAYGVPVVMTRYDDTYLTVGSRPVKAYSEGCNLFISIHCNSGGASGTEVWKSITEYHDDNMANKILSNVTAAIGTGSRGVKTRTGDNGDYYGVIRGSAAKGITGMIVEVAFIDGDYSKLNSSTNRANAGKAIADAILESKGIKR